MQASHINAQQGSLLSILGTTMPFGFGPVQTLCTARNTPPLVRGEGWVQPPPLVVLSC